MRGPRFLDAVRAARLGERTLRQYRLAVSEFLLYLSEEGFRPSEFEEYD